MSIGADAARAAPLATASPPQLVFAWGNRSRGDDALGPLFLETLRARLGADHTQTEWLEDFQLQVEHALDLQGRSRVLFVDASQDCAAPFEVSTVLARRDASFTSHAMSPQALLQVYLDLHQQPAPPCTLLAIRAEQFALGTEPSEVALANLAQALDWAQRWLKAGSDPGCATDTPAGLVVRGPDA